MRRSDMMSPGIEKDSFTFWGKFGDVPAGCLIVYRRQSFFSEEAVSYMWCMFGVPYFFPFYFSFAPIEIGSEIMYYS